MQYFPAAPETVEAMQFQTGFHPFCRPCLGTEGEQLPSIHSPQAKGLACLRIQCRHLFRRKIPTELPVLQQQIAIRQTVQIPEAVFGHQDRHTGGFHGLQQAPQFSDALQVQIGGRLVQHHHLGHGRIDAAAGYLLFFTAGQGKDAAIHQRLQPQLRYHPVQASAHLLPGHILVFQLKGQLPRGIRMKELGSGILKHTSHHPGEFRQGGRCRRHTTYQNIPLQPALVKMAGQAVNNAQQRRFSTAAFTAQHHALPFGNVKRNVVQAGTLHFL